MKQLFGPYYDSSVTQNTVNAILLVKNLFALDWSWVNFNLNAKQQIKINWILKQYHIVFPNCFSWGTSAAKNLLLQWKLIANCTKT